MRLTWPVLCLLTSLLSSHQLNHRSMTSNASIDSSTAACISRLSTAVSAADARGSGTQWDVHFDQVEDIGSSMPVMVVEVCGLWRQASCCTWLIPAAACLLPRLQAAGGLPAAVSSWLCCPRCLAVQPLQQQRCAKARRRVPAQCVPSCWLRLACLQGNHERDQPNTGDRFQNTATDSGEASVHHLSQALLQKAPVAQQCHLQPATAASI